jgi:sulfur carrier protein ThiS/soluble cytochrome b562
MFHYIEQALDNIRRLVQAHGGKREPRAQATTVEDALKPLEQELEEVVTKLKGMEGPVMPRDLRAIREILGHVDAVYHEGRFDLPGVQGIPPGQARAAQLLSEAHDLLRTKLESSDAYRVAPELRSYHDQLENIIHALDDLAAHKPDIKPADLRPYRTKLAQIDSHYHMATFETPSGGAPEGVAIVAELLNSAHEKMRAMLDKTGFYTVEEPLRPMHDRLTNLMHGLEALKARGANVSEKELAKYRDALQKVDASYKGGKFEVGGSVPGGQAVLADLLEKVHGTMNEVQQMVA